MGVAGDRLGKGAVGVAGENSLLVAPADPIVIRGEERVRVA